MLRKVTPLVILDALVIRLRYSIRLYKLDLLTLRTVIKQWRR